MGYLLSITIIGFFRIHFDEILRYTSLPQWDEQHIRKWEAKSNASKERFLPTAKKKRLKKSSFFWRQLDLQKKCDIKHFFPIRVDVAMHFTFVREEEMLKRRIVICVVAFRKGFSYMTWFMNK
ncbi:hypothetical protein NPIL_351561 [Nephila pilipes]|uniref:Uncharacterized protein n=1 Tax=Nephila pilipes TaxID=299642 RepID=A0A8X6UMA3_NEPPI|nr:hypothetical protein NPIL_351561 [Nephila pilipes]